MDYLTLETKYIPDADFAQTVHETDPKERELANIEGHMRWVIKPKKGDAYIVRPESTK